MNSLKSFVQSMKVFNFYKNHPFQFLIRLFTIYLGMSFLQRVVYFFWIFFDPGKVVPSPISALLKGIIFDIISGTFLFLVPILVLFILPRRWFEWRPLQILLGFFFSLFLLLAFFMVLSEGFFFAEFHSRFNFIAVDYLVYSQEVFHNAVESYPLTAILIGLGFFWLPFAIFLIKQMAGLKGFTRPFKDRAALLALLILIPSPLFLISEDTILAKDTYWTREMSKDTLFALFSAYNKNSINFSQFYATLDSKEARQITHAWLDDKTVEKALELEKSQDISLVRNIVSKESPKKWNVVVVVIESLSAHFMGVYGDKQNLTPHMDKLAKESLFFNKIYATGTRTVRGLEALALSLPPTPGQSILRRPNSDGMFNISSVFNQEGYQSQFIYGGYAYFDNMREWFSSNGFEVVDRTSFPSEQIHFGNVWGGCDEDLFDQVLNQADKLYGEKKPFFQMVMTTSNHRPYTYPEGRIDIPSHTGRAGAVKYTDYAIQRFIDMAKTKPWFTNTLLVFVADHNASVAGGDNIPLGDYLIPMIFYNPNLVPTKTVETLGSQIDFAPTILGLMGWSYQSRFFGHNLLVNQSPRALMGTYQKVALMNPGQMTILEPNKKIEYQKLNEKGKVIESRLIPVENISSSPDQVKQAISIYQSASEIFSRGEDKLTKKFPKDINVRTY